VLLTERLAVKAAAVSRNDRRLKPSIKFGEKTRIMTTL
jgi:hypothetical protein